MDLTKQLQMLVDEAPEYGVPEEVMVQAINPVLAKVASELKHLEYYILQTLDGGWVLIDLQNINNQNPQKKQVVYAFSTLKDSQQFLGTDNPEVLAISLPVTHILLQMFAVNEVDSLIFLETPDNLNTGIEVHRANLHDLIQTQIQQLGRLSPSKPGKFPPNIA